MLEQFYPSTERALFVKRQAELARLAYCCERLQEGRPQAANLALFGLRRIGKTMLLKEFIIRTLETCPQVVPVYLDLEHVCSAPEAFALGLIGAVCYWFGRRGKGSPREGTSTTSASTSTTSPCNGRGDTAACKPCCEHSATNRCSQRQN